MAKSEREKQKDRMGRFHNRVVKLISESKLDLPETYMVISNIGISLLENLRKNTDMER